ncbi:MAG TPA: hypothetical protein VHG11_08885 [Pseudorhizobium sp.]|nr:hypothetical protein [Pseudorhizobium sp.]
MALFPPTLRIPFDDFRSARACLPSLALSLFLIAFFGLVVDMAREVRLKGGAVAAESRSDIPNLSKRDPLRFIAADARREGTSLVSWHGGGGLLPAFTTSSPLLERGSAQPRCQARTCPGSDLASSNRSRAPPPAA